MTRGQGELVVADARERRAKEVETTRPTDIGDDTNIVGVGVGWGVKSESFASALSALHFDRGMKRPAQAEAKRPRFAVYVSTRRRDATTRRDGSAIISTFEFERPRPGCPFFVASIITDPVDPVHYWMSHDMSH